MQRVIISGLAVLLLLAGGVRAQVAPAPVNGGASLSERKKQFEAAFRELLRQDQEAAKLRAQRYRDSLAALEDAFQAAGNNMPAVLAVHNERERFARAGDIPDAALATTPPELRRLQDTWRAQTAAWPQEQAQRIVALSEHYLQSLGSLPPGAGADAVLAEKERLLGNSAVRDALALVQAARPPPPKPEPPKPPPAAPETKPLPLFVDADEYKTYPPGREPPLKNLLALHLEFPSTEARAAQMFYELHAAITTSKSEHWDKEKEITFYTYTTLPRLTLITRNRDVPAGSWLVLEYYSHPLARMSNLRSEKVEHIPVPALVRGQALVLDGRGISLTRTKDRSSTTREFYGLIASLFDAHGTLLFQQCTSTALAPFCSAAMRAPEDQKGVMEKAVERFAPGWAIAHCGADMSPGLYPERGGRKNVLVTHPADKDTACVLWRRVTLKSKVTTLLRLAVGHHPGGDWDLIVKVDKEVVLQKTVGQDTAVNGWLDVTVDLSPYAGKTILLELLNQPNGWSWEGAYWAQIALENPKGA